MQGAGVRGKSWRLPLLPSSMARNWQVFASVTRASAWWEHKVPTYLAVAYLTAYVEGVPFDRLLPRLVVLLVAIAAAASYVSILNDVTDAEDDARSGKSNQMNGRTARFKATSLAVCLLVGLLCEWLFRASPLTVVLYGATWLAFTLYSAPPLRLKTRGIFGVLCDASGAQVFPTVWACTYVVSAT